MAANLLSALASAAVLERCANRDASFLRVTPRFLSHAEETGLRLRMNGTASHSTHPAHVLAAALATWDDFHRDPNQGATMLVDLLEARGQLGALRPVFPALEQFTPIAA